MSIRRSLYEHATIRPIKWKNQAEVITKNADGSMTVRTKGGDVYTVEDAEVQEFIVYTMLNDEVRESRPQGG